MLDKSVRIVALSNKPGIQSAARSDWWKWSEDPTGTRIMIANGKKVSFSKLDGKWVIEQMSRGQIEYYLERYN